MVLRFEDVSLRFGKRTVLRDVALSVPAGHMVVVKGRSGSGKSSLLALAAGLQAPSSGRVLLQGRPIATDDASAARRAEEIGLVFQHLNLLPELNVAENVGLPLQLAGRPSRERRQIVNTLLQTFDIAELANRRPMALSGGEQQRVAIARALALQPELLLVDEPTSALDAENAAQVVRALQTAAEAGAAVLVVTHDAVFEGVGTHGKLVDGQLVGALAD